jgi:hypothetical protein
MSYYCHKYILHSLTCLNQYIQALISDLSHACPKRVHSLAQRAFNLASTEAGGGVEGVSGLFLWNWVMGNIFVVENIACHSGATSMYAQRGKAT